MNLIKTLSLSAIVALSLTACGGSNTEGTVVTVSDNPICKALDKGASVESIVRIGLDAGTDPAVVGRVIGASVKDECPQHKPAIAYFLAGR